MNTVVTHEIRGSVAVVTLNRPEVRNAIDLALRTQLQEAMETLDRDPAVLIVVLTGAGGNFCSGRDLKAVAAGEPMYLTRQDQQQAFTRRSIRKPVIAAVEGYALAGGFELALSCDLVVAAANASFGLPEVKRNLVAIGGGLIRLPRRIPYHLAMQLALTGDPVGAQWLDRWGILSRISEPGRSLDDAIELAETIAANGPSAVRATKAIVRNALEWTSEDAAFDAQLAAAEEAFSSPDRQEGVAAFLERRDPVWTDR